MSEVYEYVIIENGQRIDSPERCYVCKSLKEDNPSYCVRKCNVCGHWYTVSHDTQDTRKTTEGKCWCDYLVIAGFIKKAEDYPEYYKKCLKEIIGDFETIGMTCFICKKRTTCKKPSTANDVLSLKGYCEDLVL